MTRIRPVLLSLTLSLLLTPSAHAYSQVFFFGASLTDSGHTYSEMASYPGGTCATYAAPYVGGTCSNGPVWSEVFAAELGLSAEPATSPGGTNYAVGAATAIPDFTVPLFGELDGNTEDFGDQIDRFAADYASTADPGALYVISFAGNDINLSAAARGPGYAPLPGTVEELAQDAADAVILHVLGLAAMGAQDFFLLAFPEDLDLPDPGILFPSTVSTFAAAYNIALQAGLAAPALAALDITVFDIQPTLDLLVANPAIDNGSCLLDPACSLDPEGLADGFLYFDGVHPTRIAAEQIGLAAAAVLAPIPEPTTALLVGMGLVGLAAQRRRAAGPLAQTR